MHVYKDTDLIYKREYGPILEKEVFETLISGIFYKLVDKIYYRDYNQVRISFSIENDFRILFLFIHNKNDDFILIKKELTRFKEEFLKTFKDNLNQLNDPSNLKKFDVIVDSIQNKLPPTISLVGYDGVGKTTIIDLIRTIEIPIQPAPQITGNIATLKIGKLYFLLRDFTGQQEIGFLWNNFIRGSDFILLITNSTLENVERSKFFIKKIEEEIPNALVIALGNKQDIEDALEPSKIDEILGVKTYATIAKNEMNRDKLIQIITNTLMVQDLVSPILEAEYERNNLIEELDNAFLQINFRKADVLYKKIVKICLDLGENPLNMEFYKKYQEIQERSKKTELIQEFSKSPITTMDGQKIPQSISSLENLLQTLLTNYLNSLDGILAVIISDREGFVITSKSKKDAGDESVLGAIAVMTDTYIERIKMEFGNETSFFNITIVQDKKFAYCSMGLKSILFTITNLSTNDTELRVYSEHIAGKVELLLDRKENVSLEIPEIIRILSKTKSGKIPSGDYLFKLIITGDFAVGKTSLITRFAQNLFKEDYHSTIGVDISQKEVKLNENSKVKFIIWDIGAQIPKMAPYRKRFYEGAKCAFIVIDRTRTETFESVDKWYNEVKKFIEKEIDIILVGNKSDLIDDIVVSEEDIRAIANRYGFNYIVTSAKTGENVDDSFKYIAYKFIASIS